MNATNRFLLTGAGFTHNFGGPLANEMWGMILNHARVRALPSLRERLLEEFDFEAVHHQVQTSGTEEEQAALQEAIFDAYGVIDEVIGAFNFEDGSPYPVNIYKVQELIRAFAGQIGQPGFVFTLNQDLFLERHYYKDTKPSLPGVLGPHSWFSPNVHYKLAFNGLLAIPNQTAVDTFRKQGLTNNRFWYLKLHGSCNWRSSSLHQPMVIGRGKDHQIEREPLLCWYFEVFKECLSSQGARLLVIGYGFCDPHINQALAEAIASHGLQLYLLTPESPAALRCRLKQQHCGDAVWRGVAGYYQTTLARLFPANQDITTLWKKIVADFFGGTLTWPGSG